MAQGTLKIFTTIGEESLPVGGVSYAIKDKQGNILFSGITDESGESGVYTLNAPPRDLTLAPNPNIRPYGVYDVTVLKPGFVTLNFIDVEIFDGIDSILPITMLPQGPTDEEEEITTVIPPPTAALPSYPQAQVAPPDEPIITNNEQRITNNVARIEVPPVGRVAAVQAAALTQSDPLPSVRIPDYVIVHLGTPSNSAAPNVRVRFIDYIKNVTSSEIYPTWPVNSIIANVHCIVSFVLNRIYTEWYPSRGYNFTITNSTTVDQYFVPNRNIFQNISQIVDGIFNVYARRVGFRNPYFTEYCNGTTATCKGLSQWGTVTLANRGMTPLQILHNYYPRDLALFTAPSGNVISSYPGTPLSLGSTGENVRLIQNRLNRIRANYPAIPQITNPNGVFGPDTQAAVRKFQQIFYLLQDGIVGRSTWHKITQIFVAVTKLAELNGEGERIGLSPTPPTVTIRQGSRGADVIHAQFLLNYIGQFYPEIPIPIMDSVFGPTTTAAVTAFQRRFGLTADGVVGPATWRRMYEIYSGIIGQEPPSVNPPQPPPPPTNCPTYPGFLLRPGSTGAAVRDLQTLLNTARRRYSAVPAVSVDGVFGPLTAASVRTFQLYAGLTVDGIVGPATWAALRAICLA